LKFSNDSQSKQVYEKMNTTNDELVKKTGDLMEQMQHLDLKMKEMGESI